MIESVESVEKKPVGKRLMSLDALRGFDLFWIVGGGAVVRELICLVGSEGVRSVLLPQFNHVPWEGYHYIEDTIMPLFLFIVGVAMPFSFAKRLSLGTKKSQLYKHILVRVVILWVLGMMVQGRLLGYEFGRLRFYSNTLQAIAAGYLIASVILLNLRVKWQVWVTAGILVLYWGLLMLVPVPGYGAGVLTEDGNLAIWVDKAILGSFQDGTPYTWILSSMVFGTTVMLGVFAGGILRSDRSEMKKFGYLAVLGAGCMVLGWIWSLWFPIIKHIWTSSFVLYAGGFSLLLLALFYLVIDVCGLRKWAFGFVVIGMNAIAVYTATEIFNFGKVSAVFTKGLEKYTGNWYEFIDYLVSFLIVWGILWWMYRKKSFVKI